MRARAREIVRGIENHAQTESGIERDTARVREREPERYRQSET